MPELTKTRAQLPPDQEAIWLKCRHPTGTFVEFEKHDIEQSIAARFEQIAARYPRNIAVRTEHRSITYDELNRAANRVSHTILTKHGDGNEPVIVLFEHGIPVIIAILGALKAGKIYVPLDPAFPQDRISLIVEDCQAKLLLTNTQNLGFASALDGGGGDWLNIDAIDNAIADDNLNLVLSPDVLASIMYTSGSTGRPKGVVQNHLGILHRAMIYTNMLRVSPSDRLTLLHSASFGSSIHHFFSSLLNGATLYPFESPLGAGLPLARWLMREQISIYHSVPSLFRQLTGALNGAEEFPFLRAISLTGAPISADDVALYKNHFSAECILVHLMGATEAGWIRRYAIDKTTPVALGTVPVGFPIEEKTVSLVDDNGAEPHYGETGEIAVRSRYLAVGYWNKPELTAEKFISPPAGNGERIYLTGDSGRFTEDDCLFHAGRKDFLVKVRGFRIETGEVESALRALENVNEAAVIATPDRNAESQLIAYVVPKDDSPLSPTTLRRMLREKLPDYMIPPIFVMLTTLPLTANGKVDRKALPDPGNARPQIETTYMAPATAVEKSLAQIWAEVLDLSAVGIHDDFVELGGHSLLATRIIGKINETFGIEVSMRSLLDVATVAGLASLVAGLCASKEKRQTGDGASANDEEISEI